MHTFIYYVCLNSYFVQGVCCRCDRWSSRFDRAMTFKTKGKHDCLGAKKATIAHCMELSPLLLVQHFRHTYSVNDIQCIYVYNMGAQVIVKSLNCVVCCAA